MTMADAHIAARRSKRIPKIVAPVDCIDLIGWFWDIRSFIGGVDNPDPVTMREIRDWQDHSYIIMDKWQRDAVFEMDRALRRGYMNSVKFHMKRHAGRSKGKTDG